MTTITPEAIRRPTEVVGEDGVLLTGAERDTCRDPYWFQGDCTYDSSALVFPASTDRVRDVVHAYRRFVERIKDAVDPDGILSPGRHGVGPGAYREAGA